MNKAKKLEILGESAKYDRCNYSNLNVDNFLSRKIPGIYNATSNNGCTVPLFKVLMTNKCINDCKYCFNHSKHGFKRVEFSPEEMVSIFLYYYNNRYVDGLFLSSGIASDVEISMENMVDVARKLRMEHEYVGYIHLKILPGSSYELIKRAMSLADRVSLNIETATPDGLEELTSTKNYYNDILRPIKWVKRLLNRDKGLAPSGQTTQFIVGATDETDQEILEKTQFLQEKMDIKRSYFSAFEPIENTPLESHAEPHSKRTSRLYQADYLIQNYGFNLDELVFHEDGNLKVERDPKYYVALSNQDQFPVNVNDVPYDELIRVPGIGRISARRIIKFRNDGKQFKRLEELKRMGVIIKRAEPFIKLNKNYQSTLEF